MQINLSRSDVQKFYDSRDFPRDLKITASLIYICKELGATKYLTGHGASKYISVNEFESNANKSWNL